MKKYSKEEYLKLIKEKFHLSDENSDAPLRRLINYFIYLDDLTLPVSLSKQKESLHVPDIVSRKDSPDLFYVMHRYAKILGKDATELTDEELQDCIYALDAIALSRQLNRIRKIFSTIRDEQNR